MQAMAIWRIWLLHCERAAASRTFWMAGNSNPIRMAMMAITTRSSISVKPRRRTRNERRRAIRKPPHGEERTDRDNFDWLLFSLKCPVFLLTSSPHHAQPDSARHAKTRRGYKVFHRCGSAGLEWQEAPGAAAMTSPKQVALLIETSNAYG